MVLYCAGLLPLRAQMELLRELSGIWRGGCDAAGAVGGQRGKGGWGVLLVEASLVTVCALLFEVSSAWA